MEEFKVNDVFFMTFNNFDRIFIIVENSHKDIYQIIILDVLECVPKSAGWDPVGLEYTYHANYLITNDCVKINNQSTLAKNSLCTCSIQNLMIQGCKCGGN